MLYLVDSDKSEKITFDLECLHKTIKAETSAVRTTAQAMTNATLLFTTICDNRYPAWIAITEQNPIPMP
ncbi:hypothetical protein ACTMU2_23260 [Cupriavidus basilensis]